MADFQSGSEIAARAEKYVLTVLDNRATHERVIARELSPTIQVVDAEMHLYAAELFEQLLKAAPGIFHDRDRLIADAEATKERD